MYFVRLSCDYKYTRQRTRNQHQTRVTTGLVSHRRPWLNSAYLQVLVLSYLKTKVSYLIYLHASRAHIRSQGDSPAWLGRSCWRHEDRRRSTGRARWALPAPPRTTATPLLQSARCQLGGKGQGQTTGLHIHIQQRLNYTLTEIWVCVYD